MRFIHGILRSFVYFPASLFSSGFAFAFACVTCIQIHTIHVFNMRVVSLFSGCAFIAVCTVHTYQLTQSLARLLIQRNAMSRNNCRFFFPFLITIIVSNKLASITVITIIFHELWCAIASMHGTSTMNEWMEYVPCWHCWQRDRWIEWAKSERAGEREKQHRSARIFVCVWMSELVCVRVYAIRRTYYVIFY